MASATGWQGNWRGLLAADADEYWVQEARVPTDAASVAAAMDGATVEASACNSGMQVTTHTHTHLLAFVHREGLCGVRSVAIAGLTVEQARRLQYAVVHLGGQRALHVVQVYGHADGPCVAEDNETLLLATMSWLRSLGDVPALLVGDFNLVPQGTSVPCWPWPAGRTSWPWLGPLACLAPAAHPR